MRGKKKAEVKKERIDGGRENNKSCKGRGGSGRTKERLGGGGKREERRKKRRKVRRHTWKEGWMEQGGERLRHERIKGKRLKGDRWVEEGREEKREGRRKGEGRENGW